jgi:hypothetical protein
VHNNGHFNYIDEDMSIYNVCISDSNELMITCMPFM